MTELTEKEIQTLIKLSKKVLWQPPEVRRRLQDENINITPANFYSDIPLLSDLDNNFELNYKDGPYDKVFDIEYIGEFIHSLIPYSKDFNPPSEKPDGDQYYWKNPAFSFCDAMAYYCMIRSIKPKRILEIGSGYSTLVADEAIKANGVGEIISVEPYPFDFLKNLDSMAELKECKIQDVSTDEFTRLIEDTDILFIDSTHTCKMGSDCLYIYLSLLPLIEKKIMVHTHDVYLPYGMPDHYARDKHIYWTEQYLLYAYLLKNENSRVVFPSFLGSKIFKTEFQEFMGGKHPVGGASFWYELNVNKK